MANDKTIEYQGKLINVTNNIEQLETLDINTDYYKSKIEEIKKETKLKVKNEYDSYDKSEKNIFLHDILVSIYEESITRLDKINNHIISEYETYYKINGKRRELKDKIDNLNTNNIKELIKETQDLLKSIKSSSTIDYEQERKLVEDIYKIVYDVIKIEIIYTKKDTLLKDIKTDETDISFISKLINDEIKEILKEKNNEQLITKLYEINKKGFDDIHFLDKELIIIIISNTDNNLLRKIEEEFLNELDNYEDKTYQLQRIINKNEEKENEIIEIKKENKSLSLKRLGKKIIFLLDISLVTLGITGAMKFNKEHTKTTVYNTYKSVYDTSLDVNEDATSEYLPDVNNSVTLVEYTPWQEPGLFRDNYERKIYTYNLDQIDEFYENPEEYLNPELKDLISYTEEIDYSEEKPIDDYKENKYVIEHTYQDKSDFIDTYDSNKYINLNIFSTFLISFINLPALYFLFRNNLKLQKKDNKKLLEVNKKMLLENKQELISLQEELKIARDNLNKQYEELPIQIQQDKNIKKKILTLNNNSN